MSNAETNYITQAQITVQPIPDSPLYRRMKDGHRIRKGHELTGYLDTSRGYGVLVRVCCPEDNA